MSNTDSTGFSVLIVDDSEVVRRSVLDTLSVALEELDLPVGKIWEAANGIEALRILETNKPALILSDYEMPKMNGVELLKSVKSNPKLNSIPVLLMTAATLHEPFVRSVEASGALGVLAKPFFSDVLSETILAALKEPQPPAITTTPVTVRPAPTVFGSIPKAWTSSPDTPRGR